MGCFREVVQAETAIKIINMLGKEKAVQLLHTYYGGCSIRNLPNGFGYSYSPSSFYRYIHTLTTFIYNQIDRNLHDGRLAHTNIELHFGQEWEADGKVIPISPAFNGETYSRIWKNGRRVLKFLLEDIVDRMTHFCLASEPGGNGTVSYYVHAYAKAKDRAGFPPRALYVDGEQSEALAAGKGMSRATAVIVKKKIGDKSQLHTIEGIHKVMDRKLESGIHSKNWLSLLWGVWLHYNFAEPKDFLKGLTPFEAAWGNRLLTSGWEWLLDYSLLAAKKHMSIPAEEKMLTGLDTFLCS
jgi:hypothetical protein